MIHALWVVWQHVGLTLVYESRCWMEKTGNLFITQLTSCFCVDNITGSTLRSKAAEQQQTQNMLFAS